MPFFTSSSKFFSEIVIILWSNSILDDLKNSGFSIKNKNCFWNFRGIWSTFDKIRVFWLDLIKRLSLKYFISSENKSSKLFSLRLAKSIFRGILSLYFEFWWIWLAIKDFPTPNWPSINNREFDLE